MIALDADKMATNARLRKDLSISMERSPLISGIRWSRFDCNLKYGNLATPATTRTMVENRISRQHRWFSVFSFNSSGLAFLLCIFPVWDAKARLPFSQVFAMDEPYFDWILFQKNWWDMQKSWSAATRSIFFTHQITRSVTFWSGSDRCGMRIDADDLRRLILIVLIIIAWWYKRLEDNWISTGTVKCRWHGRLSSILFRWDSSADRLSCRMALSLHVTPSWRSITELW